MITDETYVQGVWNNLMKFKDVRKGNPSYWFEEIRKAYTNRPYHNLAHLRMCLEHSKQRRHILYDPDAVDFAFMFHDLVQEPGSDKNEIHSAKRAVEAALTFGLGKVFAERVEDIIMATVHDGAPLVTIEEKYVADIDLVILASPEEEYRTYAKAVRQEYGHVKDETFYAGRKKFLETLLGRKELFQTIYFEKNYLSPAQENMTRELKEIETLINA